MYKFNGKPGEPLYTISTKHNSNCPAEEKNGSGPGSCGGSTKRDIKSTVQSLHVKREKGHAVLRNKLIKLFDDQSKFQVTGRLKTIQSIEEKMNRKKENDPTKFDDISGLRIITSDAKSTQEAIRILKSNFKTDMKSGSEDNYIENPKETGYHAYHVTIIAGGEPHEVQVRTERFNTWAETYHSVYKGEAWTKNANTPETFSYFNNMAKVYQDLDENKSVKNIPPCPNELKDIGLCLPEN